MGREWLAKAQWAAARGDYAAAGDLYRLAGRLSRALTMYRKGRHHRLAGEVALQLGEFAIASREFELGGMSLEAAEQAVRAGDRERAARLFVEAGQARRAAQIQEEGGRPAAAAALYEHAGDFLRAAKLFLDAREATGAARTIDAAAKAGINPREERELVSLSSRCAQLHLAAGNPEHAARWFERGGRPADAARAWERAGRVREAILGWLAASAPDKAAALAETHPQGLELEIAAEAFRAAGRWSEAASLFVEAGRPAEAAACLEHLGCQAEAALAHEAAGDLPAAAASQERAGNFGEAARLHQRAGARRDAARCFEAAGEIAAAAACLAEADDRVGAAALYERLGDIDRALKILQSEPAPAGQMFAASLLLGRLFGKKGLDSLAVDQYRRALTAEPDAAGALEALYLLATALERLGRTREAAAALRRIVGVDIRHRDAAQRLERLEKSSTPVARAGRGLSLPERYKIESQLPERSPGSAWLARDAVMERQVVLRRFGADLAPGEKAVERLLADVRRVARLHHPAIAVVHDAARHDDGVYVVEEHVPGRTLREVLQQEGVLDVPRAVQIFTRLAEALDYAHGLGLLARNIRPETVVITPSGEAKLIDFGLAFRCADGAGPPRAYRPPELSLNEKMDPASDIYLLGVIVWEMLVGAPPTPPPPGQSSAPTLPVRESHPVPELLRRVIGECLQPDRGQRIGSAQKLLEELHGTNLLPGALLANRYEILRELGRGGMGTVFAAKDLVLDEPVALKVLGGALDENTERRFIQEIRLTRQINHPNVVRVHTFERWRELRFIVMEYIEGPDLRRWASHRHPISIAQAVEVLAGVASGLAAAHRLGIVHRDVKPENVLLDPDHRPRLVDFGIARQGDIHLTREGLVMGSPAYMAPEQIRGEPADHRADVYALGVLAYFLVAGREPFASENVAEVLRQQLEQPPPALSTLRRDVPPAVEALIARALVKDPARRMPSVAEFLERLTAARTALATVTA